MRMRGFAIYGPQTLITMTGVETVGAAPPAVGVIPPPWVAGAAQGCCNGWRSGQQSCTVASPRRRVQ